MSLCVRAPGKVMLSGEYVVLEGVTALVMAVDRHARARTVTADETASALPIESAAAITEARACGLLRGVRPLLTIDVSPLNDGARKLGLGSSAAAAVATLGAALVLEGHDLDDRAVREQLARAARRGHRHAQGGGSGVDVLASAFGGVVAATLGASETDEPTIEPRAMPAALHYAVLWTGVPVRTSELLRRVQAMPAVERRARMHELGAAAQAFDQAFRAENVGALLAATHAHRAASDALGLAAGADIVTAPMRALARSCEALGVAIKPSGAGGGDVLLAFAASREALDRAVTEAAQQGFTRLDLLEDRQGVTIDPQ